MPAYSLKAQPYLNAIADGIFSSEKIRNWLISGTPAEAEYFGADVLNDEQRRVRCQKKPTKQPFWANYWCGKDARCTCRIEGSRGLESDAIFFLRNRSTRRVLAIHVEFKHSGEAFGFGQPEAYPLRADCFSKRHSARATINPHHDWTTTIFCGSDALSDDRISNFQRVITHDQASIFIPGYPPQG
ncbi:hypothetical protein JQ594_01905 [Bradyrhizobium manausense]|uniref:hypothetical protein n=1 Tax=Bradyrhizobium manausense TaxID=989370 RepID=UPI001BA8DA53|nr:hypothetical protein [Bradyrhizobium manausense]MBR0684656.1 hypothetical protein [Bradyrhizobium manausense]